MWFDIAHDHLHVVFHKKNGDPLTGDLRNQVIDLLRFDGIAACGRFIEKQHTRLRRERAGNLQALQRTIGERTGSPLGSLGKAHPFQQFIGASLRCTASTARRRQSQKIGQNRSALMQVMTDGDVFEDGHRLEYLQVLKGARQAALGQRCGPRPVISSPASNICPRPGR